MVTIAELLRSKYRMLNDTPSSPSDELLPHPFAGLSASKLREIALSASTLTPHVLVNIKRRLSTIPTLSHDRWSRESIRRTQLFIVERPALDYALEEIQMRRVTPRQLLAVPRTFLIAVPPESSLFERAPLKRIDLIEQPDRTIDLVWCDTMFKRPTALAVLHSKAAVSTLLDSQNITQENRERLLRNTTDDASVTLLPRSLARLCMNQSFKQHANQQSDIRHDVLDLSDSIIAAGTWPEFSALHAVEQLPYLILAALMPAVSQPSHADTSSERPIVRYAAPLNPCDPIDTETVHVFDSPTPVDESTPHAVIDHNHRWVVSGHWKMQPYGPHSSLRKRIYVKPYVAGPAGTPIIDREHVVRITS